MFKNIIEKLFKKAKDVKVGSTALDKKVDDHLASWEKKTTVVATEVDEAIKEISSEVSEASREIKKAAKKPSVKAPSQSAGAKKGRPKKDTK
jgi:hypothetical protein